MKQIKYILAGSMILVGLLIVLGVFDFRYNHEYASSFRVMFGLVLMLMGVYRFANYSKQNRDEN